jgi:hypothetical protein
MTDTKFAYCATCGRKVSLNGQLCARCGADLGTNEGGGQKGTAVGVIGGVIPTHNASGAPLKRPPILSMVFTHNKIVFMHMDAPKEHSETASGMAALAGIATFGSPGAAAVRGITNIYNMHKAGKSHEEFTSAINACDPDELLSMDGRNFAIPYADIKMIEMKRPRANQMWGCRRGDMRIEKRPNEKSASPATLAFKLGWFEMIPAFIRRVEAEDKLLARLQGGVLSGKLSVRPWSKK